MDVSNGCDDLCKKYVCVCVYVCVGGDTWTSAMAGVTYARSMYVYVKGVIH